MKSILFPMLLILLFSTTLYAKTEKLVPSPVNDFRGHKLGTGPTSKMILVPNQELDANNVYWLLAQGLKIYKLPDEYMEIGSIELKSIHYYYFQNKLFQIAINLPFKTHVPAELCFYSQVASRAFEEKYGKKFSFPSRANSLGETKGYIEFSDTTVTYTCSTDFRNDKPNRHISFIIHDKELRYLANKSILDSIESGAKDL
jgi:hypothetical protein